MIFKTDTSEIIQEEIIGTVEYKLFLKITIPRIIDLWYNYLNSFSRSLRSIQQIVQMPEYGADALRG